MPPVAALKGVPYEGKAVFRVSRLRLGAERDLKAGGMREGAAMEQPTLFSWSGAATSQSSVFRKPVNGRAVLSEPDAGEVVLSTMQPAEVCSVTAFWS